MVSNVYRMCAKCNVHITFRLTMTWQTIINDNSSHSSTINDEIRETDQVLKNKLIFYSLLEPTENLS